MHPLEVYYLNQVGRGPTTPVIGTLYSAPLNLRRGHEIRNFSTVSSVGSPNLWSGAEALDHGTVRTGGKILTDIDERSPDTTSAWDIVSNHVSISALNLISKLCGRGR